MFFTMPIQTFHFITDFSHREICKSGVSGEKFTAFDEFSSDMYKNIVIKKAFSQLNNPCIYPYDCFDPHLLIKDYSTLKNPCPCLLANKDCLFHFQFYLLPNTMFIRYACMLIIISFHQLFVLIVTECNNIILNVEHF